MQQVKQIKFFSNVSLITLEDMINRWLQENTHIFVVTNIVEVQISESPCFMVEYIVETQNYKAPVFNFQAIGKST